LNPVIFQYYDGNPFWPAPGRTKKIINRQHYPAHKKLLTTANLLAPAISQQPVCDSLSGDENSRDKNRLFFKMAV